MQQLKVLILEDREADALLMVRQLERSGYIPEWKLVSDKQSFEASLDESFDVILADYSLPSFTALTALDMLKEHKSDIPFIVVTGTVDASVALACIHQGADDYLFKDRLDRLGVSVTRALQQRALDKEKWRLHRSQAQFIQNVSHELRTPLGLIMGHANLLMSADTDFSLGPLNDGQKMSLDVVCRRADQLHQMVSDILILLELDQARLDGGYGELKDLNSLDLSKMLALAVAEFRVLAIEKDIQIEASVDAGVTIRSSLKMVSSMIDNLLANALKFTSEGSVAIELHRETETGIFVVRDTGIGMHQDDIGRIFERFCQTNGGTTRVYGGTGLGLSVVREIVLSIGGNIDVQSEYGVGSIFTITLPMEKK